MEILPAGRGVLNFLLAIYIFFSMIESVESVRDIPRYGDGNKSLHTCLLRGNNCPLGTSPGMGTETQVSSRVIFTQKSGRDIPRYGDGNCYQVSLGIILCPLGTSPDMGTETRYSAARIRICFFVRKGHPQIWGRKLFNNFFLWVFVRKGHPRAADNNIFELKRLAKKIKCKREMGFLN